MVSNLTIGSAFGAFTIEGVVGKGGMGVVYRARQSGLDRAVALKVIAPDFAHEDSFRERFRREARAAAALDHPNIVPVHDFGEHEGRMWISMRLVQGTDLKTVIRIAGRLPARRAAALLAPIASALDSAHAHGLVHRDVKPANILIAGDWRDESAHVYLTDFGLARQLSGGDLTAPGMLLGTYRYMAPEQVEGDALDGRADEYALAATTYEALTGTPPFPGNSWKSLIARLTTLPPRPSAMLASISPALDEALMTALATAREDRFPTCRAFMLAMREAAEAHDSAPGTAPPALPDPELLDSEPPVVVSETVSALAGPPADSAPTPTLEPPAAEAALPPSAVTEPPVSVASASDLELAPESESESELLPAPGMEPESESEPESPVAPEPEPESLAGSEPEAEASAPDPVAQVEDEPDLELAPEPDAFEATELKPRAETTLRPQPRPVAPDATVAPPPLIGQPPATRASRSRRLPVLVAAAIAIVAAAAAVALVARDDGGGEVVSSTSETTSTAATTSTAPATVECADGSTASAETGCPAQPLPFAAVSGHPKAAWPPTTPAAAVSLGLERQPSVTTYRWQGGDERFTFTVAARGDEVVIRVRYPQAQVGARFRGERLVRGCLKVPGQQMLCGSTPAELGEQYDGMARLRTAYADLAASAPARELAQRGGDVAAEKLGRYPVACVATSDRSRQLCVQENGIVTYLRGARDLIEATAPPRLEVSDADFALPGRRLA